MQTLQVCMSQNYFEVDDKLYSAKNVFIMGNPLSPLLAEICINHLEAGIMKHPYSKYLPFWHQYVDDALSGWTGTWGQLETIAF